jgi:phage head maturation protease
MGSVFMIEKRLSLELRARGRKLEGYAATFGNEARIGDIIESIQAGAFRDTLAAGRDIVAMVDPLPI